VTLARWAAIAGLAFALYFALQGGEYGTLDLLQLRRQEREESASVARLKTLVDSLSKAAAAIEHDPRVQERVARERFGMIKKGEFLYRLVPSGESVATEKREREKKSVSGEQ
jgi:cell division protein FtsB